jgi:hypothetical protein
VPFGKCPNRSVFNDTYGLINNLGLMSIDYGEIVGEVVKWYGIPFINVGKEAGWNDYNLTNYLNNDGAYLHPNDLGGRRIAEVAIGKIKNIEPIV